MQIERCKKGDESVYNEIFVKKIYEKKDFKIFQGEEWLDLGGYTGLFSKYALMKGAKIKAIYEPMKEMNVEIIKNTSPEINIVNAAVDVKNGETDFFIHPEGNFQRNTLYNHYKRIEMIKRTVPVVAFSEIVTPGICVKMDIEGSELKILDGDVSQFSKIKKLVFEYHLDKDWSIQNYYRRIENLKSVFSRIYYDKLNPKYEKIFPSGRIVYCLK